MMLTRNQNPSVRYAALRVVYEWFAKYVSRLMHFVTVSPSLTNGTDYSLSPGIDAAD